MEFFQVYKFLLEDEKYESLSNDARMLYAVLNSRNQLSKINGFRDETGNIFLIYQRKDLSQRLHITEKVVAKCMKQLRDLGLITEKKQGRGLPNKIFITEIQEQPKQRFKRTLHFKVKKMQDLSVEKVGSVSVQEQQKSASLNRYIDINKPIYKSKSLSCSHIQTKDDNDFKKNGNQIKKVAKGSHPLATDTNKIKYDADYNTSKKILQAKINYKKLMLDMPDDKGIVDEIVNCMLDVQMSNTATIKIAKEQKPRSLVLKIFSKINFDDIKFVIQKLKTVRKKIIHIAAYIKTMLYNCKSEIQIGIVNKKAMEQPYQQENTQDKYDSMPYRTNKFANFQQHDWDWDKIERILQEE